MVRIPCHVRRFVRGRFFPFVPFTVRSARVFGIIEALVDTGSPFTVLSTTDALKLKLPITKMRKGESVHLAGFRFLSSPIKNPAIRFRTEDGKSHGINLPKMGVLIPTKINKKTLQDVKHIPSILGNDLLEEHKLALYFSPATKVALLETVE